MIDPNMSVGRNQTLADRVAQGLYETCVPDHADYPYYLRPEAERKAFVKQARSAIEMINAEVGKFQ